MNRLSAGLTLNFAFLVIFCGCGQQQAFRKETFPVKGKVLVDGNPEKNVAVVCVRLSSVDKEHPTESQCFTLDDGSFEVGTYESKDGVPEGDYALTFRWGEWNLFTKSYDGDKLNSRYLDPETSPAKFTVKKGKPMDLGEIKLTSQ